MSAFICNDLHLSVLARAIFAHLGGNASVQAVYERLARENEKSVAYRYPKAPIERAGEVALDVELEDYSPVALFKAAQCYEHNACEHPGYKRSRARRDIRELMCLLACELAAKYHITGYASAEWEIGEDG